MENIFAQPGKPMPHGATIVNDGVNFSVFTRNGTSVILDIFQNPEDENPCFSYTFDPKINRTGDIWHVFLKGLKAGALYLYRVDGPFNPEKGHRNNKNTYLLDPYAKSFTDCSVFANLPPDYVTPVDKIDILTGKPHSAKGFPKCVVIDDDEFDWQGDRPIN